MKIKTSELTGVALDWAVAEHEQFLEDVFEPSSHWGDGGPIIERERLAVWFSEAVHDENGNVLRDACWYSETSCTTDNGDAPYKCETGDTPLIAAMRCYVASKMGDEVDVPDELRS